MFRLSQSTALATVFVVLLASGAQSQPEKKPVALTRVAKGSVAIQQLMTGAPSVITTAKGLQKLWTRWSIADKMTDVDFTKDLLIVSTTVGSQVSPSATLDAKGNLAVLNLGTADLRPGFRYVLSTVNKNGVKTVGGKELPAE